MTFDCLQVLYSISVSVVNFSYDIIYLFIISLLLDILFALFPGILISNQYIYLMCIGTFPLILWSGTYFIIFTTTTVLVFKQYLSVFLKSSKTFEFGIMYILSIKNCFCLVQITLYSDIFRSFSRWFILNIISAMSCIFGRCLFFRKSFCLCWSIK